MGVSRQRTLCCEIVFYDKSNSNKGGTTMSTDKVISLENPEENVDVLTDLLRSGARELIIKAVQTELAPRRKIIFNFPHYPRRAKNDQELVFDCSYLG
jgi:hypothetical protein